ncbi:hypothetical protein F0U61_01090 [Archangium violaceum]|uniref:ribosomal protein L7/L12 n=1 Tax=Archangium violaceum TaxID=83451 RepID=UPI002B2E63F3|nr:hypothetical protein F0U61_01090 [Archangium violaceum]
MAPLTRSCWQCGAACELGIGQTVQGGRLVWSAGYRCARCGQMVEEDGWGEMPTAYREEVLRVQGEWALEVGSAEPRIKVEVVRVLREWLGLTLADAKAYFDRIPGQVIRGTQAEMMYVKKQLSARGVDVEVRQCSGPTD